MRVKYVVSFLFLLLVFGFFSQTTLAVPIGSSCVTASLGAKECDDTKTTVVTCKDLSGVPTWTDPTPCSSGFTCNAGICESIGAGTTAPPATAPPATWNAKGQTPPIPGFNCGVAKYQTQADRDADTNASDIDACCYSNLVEFEIPYIEFPLLESVLNPAIAVLNSLTDSLPFPIIGNVLPLPTFGKIKDALSSIPACNTGGPSGEKSEPGCRCLLSSSPFVYFKKYCPNSKTPADCMACNGLYTSIGCISDLSNMGNFVNTVFKIGISLSGATAFLCIIYAAFIMQTSQGNTEKLQNAKELLTSCITGLLLVIFSIFILEVIGVDILQIPGLG